MEASQYFGSALYPFVKELVQGNFDHPVIEGATIATGGNLVKQHEHLRTAISSVLKR